MVDITNIEETVSKLQMLKADAKPLWGGMTPQHMVEHITMTIGASSGKMNVEQRTTPEEGEAIKARLIYSDAEIPKGIKSPLMGDELPAYVHADLQTAIGTFRSELIHFESYYQQNPSNTHIQPRMGALTHAEWKIFHGKHFTHHFKQFGLIGE